MEDGSRTRSCSGSSNPVEHSGRRTCLKASSSFSSSSSSVWWEESSDMAEVGGSSSGRKVIEQVLHEFRIQNAAPDWLLLLPGGSFWVPPEEKEQQQNTSRSFDNATEGELLALMMPMAWPGPDTVPQALCAMKKPEASTS